MEKLHHVQTTAGGTEEYYMISVGGSVILDSWNYFRSFQDAETALLRKFHPSGDELEYTIIGVFSKKFNYVYK